jgi:hypothetical protein
MHSFSTTPGAQVYTTTPGPFAISGLQVQAQVSGLLYSEIQRLTATNGSRAALGVKDSSSGLSRDNVPLDPLYMATNGSTAISGHVP